MNHHTTEPAAPAFTQARAITLKWHPSGRPDGSDYAARTMSGMTAVT
jgi:hypothetical protein